MTDGLPTRAFQVIQRILVLTRLLRQTGHPITARELLHQLDELIVLLEHPTDTSNRDSASSSQA
jgi:hypothetical protein